MTHSQSRLRGGCAHNVVPLGTHNAPSAVFKAPQTPNEREVYSQRSV